MEKKILHLNYCNILRTVKQNIAITHYIMWIINIRNLSFVVCDFKLSQTAVLLLNLPTYRLCKSTCLPPTLFFLPAAFVSPFMFFFSFFLFLFLSCSTKLWARNISKLCAGAELLYRDRADIRPRKPPERSSSAGQTQIYHQHLALNARSLSLCYLSQHFGSRNVLFSQGNARIIRASVTSAFQRWTCWSLDGLNHMYLWDVALQRVCSIFWDWKLSITTYYFC